MHGRRGEGAYRKRSLHMWKVSSGENNRASIVSAVDSSSVSPPLFSSANCFFKDGRKITVGDCALFKPPQDCPPFIGIIRRLTLGKENILKLSVNWLYRPAEVKLGKGILLEAAPNELFYSFHRDEIPAASLLHPCKVAFLPKGVEIPSGISSYVCRRVYDITNKRLWWLIDQGYINEHQEEVDQLLYKTRKEIHATVHTGGHSPKPMNSPTSTSHVKPGSDKVQNTLSSFHSQVKGKKREHGDQGHESSKRERCSKSDDGGSGYCRSESSFKSEISKLVDKGGLVDSEGVEKLVQLMLHYRNGKKIELSCRSMLAGVIAATDKFECLSRFVQGGLPVLDEWLQEVHKGKIGDGSGSKDSDRDAEEFLFVLLRALDKLPINLQALQMCNIGKSVNHLRTHRNLDIQKKARSLVDMWKKRVEAEMNITDAKTGSGQAVSWSARPRLSEVLHGGNRQSAGSSEVAVKSSVMQFSGSKIDSVKLIQGESTGKKVVSSPVSADSKDRQPWSAAVGGTPNLSLAEDDKSSNSCQSNKNQSSPSDHAKVGGVPGKEDGRSYATGSMSVNKVSGGSTRNWKSINGFPGVGHSGAQREIGSGMNSSLHRTPPLERLSETGLTCEMALNAAVTEGSNKLIVKIPNQNHSVAQNGTGGSSEDPTVMISRASSPTLSEKHDPFDRSMKEKIDSYQANATIKLNNESWQSTNVRDVLTGPDEGDGSPTAVLDEEHSKIRDDVRKMGETSKMTSSSSGSELNPQKLYDKAYFSSINALLDCCAKYSDTNASSSAGEDVGMNLLASVAAGEISKSEQVPPTSSEQRRSEAEHSCQDDEPKGKLSPGFGSAKKQSQSSDATDFDHENQVNIKVEETLAVEHNGCQQDRDQCLGSSGELNEATLVASVAAIDGTANAEGDEPKEKKVVGGLTTLSIQDGRQKVIGSSLPKGEDNDVGNSEVLTEGVEIPSSSPALVTGVENNKTMNEKLKSGVQTLQKSPAIMMYSEMSKGANEVALLDRDPASDHVVKHKPNSGGQTDARSHADQTEMHRAELESNASKVPKHQGVSASEASGTNHEGECMVENPERIEVQEQQSSEPASQVLSPTFPMENTEQSLRTQGSKLTGTEGDEADECTSTTADPISVSCAGGSDMDAKVEFDLNEGFNAEDGKYVEESNKTTPDSGVVQLISPLLFPVSTCLPASITVASAAKGAFVPPKDLLRSKRELGWKGSAATSAFRPAEPRKIMKVTTNISLPDVTTSKNSRLLDFDLNVADETLEDQEMGSVSDNNMDDSGQDKMVSSASGRCSGGLELDLNQIDEAADIVNFPTSYGHRLDATLLPGKSVSGLPNGKLSIHRDFDLNVGPVVDEVSGGPLPFSQLSRSSMPSQHTGSGIRMNNAELANFSSWFPPGNAYSTVSVPSVIPERGDLSFPVVASGGPQRMLAPPGSTPFSPDVFRGPVLSSSPAIPFQSNPWQYPVFPYGTSFPLPSATYPVAPAAYMDSSSAGRLCYPTLHSQFLGSAGAVSSNYQRPYLIGLPDGSNNGSTDNLRKWGRQGLDLNSGPGGLGIAGDDASSLAMRQLSVANSQALAEEQARIYQLSGSALKRKEPEAGWENYRQSSWQ